MAQSVPLAPSSWQFRQVGTTTWYPATVPGTVHTDLLANGLIEDPFYRTNERGQQWIEQADWEYRTQLTIAQDMLNHENLELYCQGLDTYATLYLNDSVVLHTNNMFRSWKANLKPFAKAGSNELRILFESPVKKVMPAYNAMGFTVPVSDNDQAEVKVSVYSRKAQYHFGWDWGPRLVTSGIWRPLYLRAWSSVDITDLFVKQLALSPDNTVQLEAQTTVMATQKGSATLRLYVDGQSEPLVQREVLLLKGHNQLNVRCQLEQVQRWWPRGMGSPHLYTFRAEVATAAGVQKDTSIRRGFRTIEVVQENHASGQSMYFRVNGKPLFVKGANYIPQDNFLPRVTHDQYRHVLQTAVDCHMNMIRVWGGGIYENKIFYDLCDELGLLVWQDFMFACAMYPPWEDLKRNIYQEALENVRRLRNHPSIALWCGNNEIAQYMNQHYWKRTPNDFRSPADSLLLRHTYEDIFHNILPSAVKALDDEKFYWASSANGDNYEINYTANQPKGDAHYWGVWWGKEPFENFNRNIMPFMSEYGFQSFPELETVKKYALPRDYHIESEVMKAHQRSSIGNGTITYYMKEYFKVPNRFEDFLYVGQLLQAEGMRMAVEAHRRAMPFCMGTLYWQINDCWPVASWSSMDYFGRWKAQQYAMRRAFAPVLLTSFQQGDTLDIFMVNDTEAELEGTLQYRLLTLEGKQLQAGQLPMRAAATGSTRVHSLQVSSLLGSARPEGTVLQLTGISTTGEVLSTHNAFFARPKDLQLPRAKLQVTIVDKKTIEVKAENLARFVWLQWPDGINVFSDNYFDLLPGEKRRITCKLPGDQGLELRQLKVTTLDRLQ